MKHVYEPLLSCHLHPLQSVQAGQQGVRVHSWRARQIWTLDELKTCNLKLHNLKSIYVICSGWNSDQRSRNASLSNLTVQDDRAGLRGGAIIFKKIINFWNSLSWSILGNKGQIVSAALSWLFLETHPLPNARAKKRWGSWNIFYIMYILHLT